MQSLLSHPALISIPAAVAVIVVVILFQRDQRATSKAFLQALKDNTVSRDTETEAFTNAIVNLVSLCQQMVGKCQSATATESQITANEVVEATKHKETKK